MKTQLPLLALIGLTSCTRDWTLVHPPDAGVVSDRGAVAETSDLPIVDAPAIDVSDATIDAGDVHAVDAFDAATIDAPVDVPAIDTVDVPTVDRVDAPPIDAPSLDAARADAPDVSAAVDVTFIDASVTFVDAGATPIARPVAPLHADRATSDRPTLRIFRPSGATGVSIDLCDDPACARVLANVPVTGDTVRPASAVPRRRLYWRVRTQVPGVGAAASATWEFVVAPTTSATDRSYPRSAPDLNGDGVNDVVVGTSSGGRNDLFLGPLTGTTIVASRSVGASGDPGWAVAISDLDGDGLDDFAVGGGEQDLTRVVVWSGSVGAIGPSPAATVGTTGGGEFGLAVAGGDFDGDGVGDLAIGAPAESYTDGLGAVYWRLGVRGVGVGATSQRLPMTDTPNNIRFGHALAGAGDVDRDGYDDLVVGAPTAASGRGRVYVYRGSPTGFSTTPWAVIQSPSGGEFGRSVSVGDVNGDGYGDVAVGAWLQAPSNTGAVYVYFGSAAGPATAPSTTIPGPDGTGTAFGVSVAASGDYDRDGYADLVVGLGDYMTYRGRARVYRGGPAGPGPATLAATLDAPVASDRQQFGHYVAAGGDLNGDGIGDALVGAYSAGGGAGRVYVYFGSLGSFPTTPSVTLQPASGVNQFGITVATRAAPGRALRPGT